METAPLYWVGTDVDVTTIERQLSNLWKRLPVGAGRRSPVRTHMFNLITYAACEEELERITRLTELSRRHPSRSIILQADRSTGEPAVDAEVRLHCVGTGGDTASYCHEQITLAVRGRAADHLASVVIPLLEPEIPTYLWWPGQPPFGYRLFHQLLSVADQLLIDSAEFRSPGDGLTELGRLCRARYGINDFNWARLTPWRELIAQFFDGPTAWPYAESIRSVRAEFGADSSSDAYSRSMAGLLLVLGWLSTRLGWQPETTLDSSLAGDVTMSVLKRDRLIPIELRFRDYGRQAATRLMRVEIVSQPADRSPARFEILRDNSLAHVTVTVAVHGESEIKRVVPLGIQSDEQLLADELELAGQDALYSIVIHEASKLAGREVWAPT